MSRSLPRVLPWCLLAATLVGCGDDNRTLVPNRVLDRPLDAVLACVRDNGTDIEVLSLNQCAGASGSRCTTSSPTPQLIGFVANSERNEVAMFRRCDKDAALVDMDPEAPGYNFIPAGSLPSALTTTEDSCRVLSANAGSCDLTVLDIAGMAAYAIDTTDADADPTPLPPPSSLTSTLIPRRSNGRPLAASPGDLLAVPNTLSLASDGTELPTDDDGGAMDDGNVDDGSFDDGAVDGTGTDDGGGDDSTPDVQGRTCDLSRPASVYVTFPSCQLVAEVALGTQQILQSRQFVTNEAGEVEVIDSGTAPLCPVDCPAQLEGDLPDEIELVDPDGVFPTNLALVDIPDEEDIDPDLAEQITYPTLFVGGPGSNEIYEIEIEADGSFADTAEALPLEGALGVHGISVTPPMSILGEQAQFLYVIGGDGSTHVVRRDPDRGSLGQECDTQVDPTVEPPAACVPINPDQANNEVNRRPFAVGPGIRAAGGATINDWVFHQLNDEQAAEFCAVDDSTDPTEERARTPFCVGGVVGVGVTSVGTVIYSSFGQFDVDERISQGVDPVEVMSAQVRPHSLWPALDPFATNPIADALPLVDDEEPGRALPGGGRDSQALSPSLRRIDMAYASGVDVSDEQEAISDALGGIDNVDQLGTFDDDNPGLYENPVTRAVVRDSAQWSSQVWTLEYEPVVPGTSSSTGLLHCDNHGGTDPDGNELAGATCRNVEPDDARLTDEGAAFCEDGVLAGDKVALLGCSDDNSCGQGQVCLREPTEPSTSTGVCVSQLAFEQERDALREDCAPFIRDPCASPRREYRITRATDNELWLAALDLPLRAIVRDLGAIDDDDPLDAVPAVDLAEYEARLSCDAPVQRVDPQTCSADEDCRADPYDLASEEPNQRGAMRCEIDDEGNGLCVGEQPDGGCNDDDECRGLGYQYMCIDSICRAPCDLCAPPSGAQPPRPCDSRFTVEGDVDGEGNPIVYTQECLGDDEVCMAGVCHVPCDDGSPGCLANPLPGPRCFPELTRYTVRLHESFAFSGSQTPFFSSRVIADPDTGQCVEDERVSTLLNSRIRVGPDDDGTFGTGPWQIPDCVNAQEAGPGDPNPCRIVDERLLDPATRFHTFRYRDQAINAIRYSNPVMTVVIDLVSLTGLVSEPTDYADQLWPAEVARFLRSRIPAGYREEFSSTNGFVPYNEPVVVGASPLVYPVRILRGPEIDVDFIVDAGGRGGIQGIRGQVARIDHDVAQVIPDQDFLVR